VAKYSQRQLDLIDLRENRFATFPFSEVVSEPDYPDLYLFVSQARDGELYDPIGRRVASDAGDLVLTFNNLVDHTPFVRTIGDMLVRLEKAYGHPVETEFTASVGNDGRIRVNLLQCRPMWVPGTSARAEVPAGVLPEHVLFRSHTFIGGGVMDDIRYVVYVDPARYAAIDSVEIKHSLGRVVGQVNARLRNAEGKKLIMGPGRFGSSNVNLGVNVSYADIDDAAVLVEMAREEAGHVPEVSYGTHFFQDLVEAHTLYLAVYPEDDESEFNGDFFRRAPNCLGDLVSDAGRFEDLVHVIDVCSAANDGHAKVVADPRSRQAVCFLQAPTT
jgi:hypothetical protein